MQYLFLLSVFVVFFCEIVENTLRICICAPLQVNLLNEDYMGCFVHNQYENPKYSIPSVMMNLVWKNMVVIAERDPVQRSCLFAIDPQRNMPIFWSGTYINANLKNSFCEKLIIFRVMQ